MITDLRVCFIGDSFVAGVGDAEHRGWVARLCARSTGAGLPLTAYNLGVRRETSVDVLARWEAECRPRLSVGDDRRIVVGVGVNDTALEGGTPRVPAERSVTALAALLDGAVAAGWPVLVVGPPPIADDGQNARIAALDVRFAEICSARDVPYVSVTGPLGASDPWRRQVAEGDGAHPGAAGYQELADLVWPEWEAWLRTRP
ncbi:GDSL-type esterase/lipase family protein [Blastococcus montanus]|uniref:GDSL-type esterase/lipase family protein n=1 Tax=Blastococcus montanus TaxID=3144973 RepID=UPI003209770C